LQRCARLCSCSRSGKFFLLTSANPLITTFQEIGTALTNLRIAQ
jgi:hypothetical protein